MGWSMRLATSPTYVSLPGEGMFEELGSVAIFGLVNNCETCGLRPAGVPRRQDFTRLRRHAQKGGYGCITLRAVSR